MAMKALEAPREGWIAPTRASSEGARRQALAHQRSGYICGRPQRHDIDTAYQRHNVNARVQPAFLGEQVCIPGPVTSHCSRNTS